MRVDGLAGNLYVATLAGSVEGHASCSADVTVQTEAGETTLRFADAPKLVRASTSLGAVELRLHGSTAYAVSQSELTPDEHWGRSPVRSGISPTTARLSK